MIAAGYIKQTIYLLYGLVLRGGGSVCSGERGIVASYPQEKCGKCGKVWSLENRE